MIYEDTRKRLEELERKIQEQGADESVLLTIDDGVDTHSIVMKRKTLYDLLRPILREDEERRLQEGGEWER